jgi:hypothetical protein
MRRVLGEDNADTLSSRNNLAYAYEQAGDLGRAIPLYEHRPWKTGCECFADGCRIRAHNRRC